jgi:type II secretory pathway pseudopilin PulG
MDLRGQGRERGYAMAALLVSLAVMSVLMSELLPVWRHQAQREKEADLAFRGEQYARAIYLYQAKFQSAPPSIDVLVQQKFLRKKYKDPMTKDGEFQLLYVGANAQPGMPQTGAAGSTTTRPGAPTPFGGRTGGQSTIGGSVGGGPIGGTFGGSQPTAAGGIMGVVSKSKEASIRVYRGATHYNEWRFVYNAQGRGGQRGMPGQPGMPGMGPGGQPFPGGPGFPGGRGPGRGRGGFPGDSGGREPRGTGPGGRGPGNFGVQPPIGRPPGK